MKSVKLMKSLFCLSICFSVASFAQSTGRVTNSQAGASTSTNSTSTNLIPAGTALSVRVNDSLSSETTQEGSQFAGTLAADLTTSDGRVIFPRGSNITGKVTSAKPSGRVSDSGELDLTVTSISSGSQSADLRVTPYEIKGQSHTRSNTEKIGGGAALGAIIGAIAGGGKGAAIGAGVGAGAGGVGAAATGKQPATVESEAVLQFITSTDASIYGVNQNSRNSTRTSGDDGLRRDGRSSRPDYNPNNTIANANTGTSDSSYSNSSNCSNTPDVRSFSARDRRVVNSCFADNPGSFRTDQSGPYNNRNNTGNNNNNANSSNSYSDQPARNQTLPYALQNKVRALPLACDRQLAPLPNNMERVYYNNQVLLLDGNNAVLDLLNLGNP
jgi:hypothetical protein